MNANESGLMIKLNKNTKFMKLGNQHFGNIIISTKQNRFKINQTSNNFFLSYFIYNHGSRTVLDRTFFILSK